MPETHQKMSKPFGDGSLPKFSIIVPRTHFSSDNKERL